MAVSRFVLNEREHLALHLISYSLCLSIFTTFRTRQYILQCESSPRCADEGAARRHDRPFAACHSRMVSKQALQAQQEGERDEAAAREGEGELYCAMKNDFLLICFSGKNKLAIFQQELKEIFYGRMQGEKLIATSPVENVNDYDELYNSARNITYQEPWNHQISEFF